MLSLSARRPLNQWQNNSIHPGPVGSVGDANVNVTFKSSLPGDYREAPYTKGKKEVRFGSNVQDGQKNSWDTNGQGARLIDGFFGGERDSITTQRGWMFQNLKSEDMLSEPVMGSLPRYGWRNQVATINNAARTGEKFASLPGGYSPKPSDVPRGGNKPGIVAGEGRDAQVLASGAIPYKSVLPTSSGLTIDPGSSGDTWGLRKAGSVTNNQMRGRYNKK
jgi:hypothetical protein